MNNSLIFSDKKQGFNVYVDLFGKGELNEILVIPDQSQFAVVVDNKKLATITKDYTNQWVKVDGAMPKAKMAQIGDMINLRLHTTN